MLACLTPAAHTAMPVSDGGLAIWSEMISAPVLAATIAMILALANPAGLPGAAPLLLLWFSSPEIARLIAGRGGR